MMRVMLSTTSRKKAFHINGCPYEKRIRFVNREEVSRETAIHMGYHACRYCSTMRGFYKIRTKELDRLAEKNNIQHTYVDRTQTLYVRTDLGFWKIYTHGNMQYKLYHLNRYQPAQTTEQMMHGSYHRQYDVKRTYSPEGMIRYIIGHDEAKRIIMVDYRKLPQKTRRQKKYYQNAEKRVRRQESRRLDYLLDCVSRGETPGSKWVSIC